MAEHSTQKFVPNDLGTKCPSINCAEGSWLRQVGRAKRGAGENWAVPNGMGPGVGCEAPIGNCTVGPDGLRPPTVQLGLVIWCNPLVGRSSMRPKFGPTKGAGVVGRLTMVGRSFGHDLVLGRTVRRSLYHTHWVCAVCCVQWAVPTDQLAQFGTKRAKGGRGLGAFGPNSGRPQFLLS